MPSKKVHKLTINVDDEVLAETIRSEARDRGLSPEAFALEVLRERCDDPFREQDLADYLAAKAEYDEKGGSKAEDVFRRLENLP